MEKAQYISWACVLFVDPDSNIWPSTEAQQQALASATTLKERIKDWIQDYWIFLSEEEVKYLRHHLCANMDPFATFSVLLTQSLDNVQ